MTKRKHTPLHDFWHPRVEGQIRDAMTKHPEWFAQMNDTMRYTVVTSIAKRIVGEIVAGASLAPIPK